MSTRCQRLRSEDGYTAAPISRNMSTHPSRELHNGVHGAPPDTNVCCRTHTRPHSIEMETHIPFIPPKHPDANACPPMIRLLALMVCATCCLLIGAIGATIGSLPFYAISGSRIQHIVTAQHDRERIRIDAPYTSITAPSAPPVFPHPSYYSVLPRRTPRPARLLAELTKYQDEGRIAEIIQDGMAGDQHDVLILELALALGKLARSLNQLNTTQTRLIHRIHRIRSNNTM